MRRSAQAFRLERVQLAAPAPAASEAAAAGSSASAPGLGSPAAAQVLPQSQQQVLPQELDLNFRPADRRAAAPVLHDSGAALRGL
jgi:hypothetical protein